MTDIFDAVAAFPRAKLLSGPTPIHRLNRLSDKFGIDLWVKREDLIGLGFGGNKIRQLEFYCGAALEKGADTILITGAVQSNYVRAAAAAAAKLGLRAILQLEERVSGMGETYHNSGNVLLGRLLGAEYMHYPVGEDEAGADSALRQRAEDLRNNGRSPYVIPLGLNNPPLGALGYMAAAREIAEQGASFDAIVVASGSGQTHGGLLSGLRALNIKTSVYGICVRRSAQEQHERLQSVMQNIASLLKTDQFVDPEDIRVWDGVLAPGYGRMGSLAESALTLMAQEEGLFLDPVYTAKAFAGVMDLLDQGHIRAGMHVLFIHTGGQPALFAYQDEIKAAD